MRVFIYLLGNCGKGITTYKIIASDLSVCENTVKNAVRALCNLDFGNMIVEKDVIKENLGSNYKPFYRCLGTQFGIIVSLEGISLEKTT